MQSITEKWTWKWNESWMFFSDLIIIFLQIAQDSVRLIINLEITNKHMIQWEDKVVLIIQKRTKNLNSTWKEKGN